MVVLEGRPGPSPFSPFLAFLTRMPSTQPRVVPWTPEEDEQLASAVTSCESGIIPAWLYPYRKFIGGSKICWKKVAASMSGIFANPPHYVRALMCPQAEITSRAENVGFTHWIPNSEKVGINYFTCVILYTLRRSLDLRGGCRSPRIRRKVWYTMVRSG